MKPLFLTLFLIPILCWGQNSKEKIIKETLLAIEKSEGASYECTTTSEVPTPVDTTIYNTYLWKLTYMINPFDSLYKMNFRYEERRKTFNSDRLISLVYNGAYYYSFKNIFEDQIPDPEYRIQDISKPSGKEALRESIKGQIPHIYKALSLLTVEDFSLRGDTIIESKKYARLAFMDDPIYEFEIWIDRETYLPYKVLEIAYLNRKKPQLVQTNKFNNYMFYKDERGEVSRPFFVNQFVVSDSQIKLEADPNYIIPQLIQATSLIPALKEESVLKTSINISPDNKKVKLIYFGMINCCPCVKAIPHLKKVYAIFNSNHEFEMFAFYPYDRPSVIRKYSEQEDLNFPISAGDKQVIKAFGLHAYPKILLVKKNGQVYKWYNYSEDLAEELLTDVQKLLNDVYH
ncbi:MAG: TlpA family protein disulfide reductase [Draconibacterium sp.]